MTPRAEHIHAENATFQQLEALRRRRTHRHKQKLFLVEGSLFALPLVRAASHRKLTGLLERIPNEHGDLQIVGTGAHASRPVYESGFWRPTVLLIGNETDGLSRAYEGLADTMVAIPMHRSATSLNVACSATVLL